MNRLNPLYLIALFITVLGISFYLLNIQRDNFIEKEIEYININKNAKEYTSFQESWNNKVYVNKILDQILRNKMYSNLKILRVEVKNNIKIKITSTNELILNDFLNKVLNKKLIIKKLEMDKTFINLEIGTN